MNKKKSITFPRYDGQAAQSDIVTKVGSSLAESTPASDLPSPAREQPGIIGYPLAPVKNPASPERLIYGGKHQHPKDDFNG
jgi:hypothetical protein